MNASPELLAAAHGLDADELKLLAIIEGLREVRDSDLSSLGPHELVAVMKLAQQAIDNAKGIELQAKRDLGKLIHQCSESSENAGARAICLPPPDGSSRSRLDSTFLPRADEPAK